MAAIESSPPPAAVVRPRAVVGDASLPVERVIEPLLHGSGCTICLLGKPGAGKSTAIRYLRSAFLTRGDVKLLDEPAPPQEVRPAGKFFIVATAEPGLHKSMVRVMLAPWSDDDMMEYLLVAHRDRCTSVLSRLHADADRHALEGVPELCRIVLDESAEDAALASLSAALRKHIARVNVGPKCAEIAR